MQQYIKNKISFLELEKMFKIELKDKTNYYSFNSSGTTGNPKQIFHKVDAYHQSFNDFMKIFNITKKDKILLTSRYDENSVYSFGAHSTLENNLIIKTNDIREKIDNINKADIIFATPSFLMSFRHMLSFNKNQRVFIGGESTPNILKNFLKQFEIEVYDFYGTSECSITAYKKINEEFFNFTNQTTKLIENKIYSEYNSSLIKDGEKIILVEDFVELSDILESKINSFKFISRSSELAKINEELVSLKEISNFLLEQEEINDLVVFKTKENELDVINLFYKSEYYDESKIRKILAERFNHTKYIPKNIFKTGSFPLTLMGKKDMRKLEELTKSKDYVRNTK